MNYSGKKEGARERFSQEKFYEEKSPSPRHNEHWESPTTKWLLAASVIQVILLLYLAVQIGGIDGTIQAAAVVDTSGIVAAPSGGNEPSVPTTNVDMKELVDDDAVKGDSDAPVTIVEFSDYECPFCARFYSQTLSQIEEQYIKTGKVKLVYRDFPLSFHPNAQKAAEAAECAGEQGKYYDMHDKLFDEGVSGGSAAFKQYAADIGLNTAEFNKCLDSGEMASEVQKDFVDGQRAGVQGTPGFIINGKVVSGAQPFQVFQQVIEAELST